MPFYPGDPNINRSGRPKGSPNKVAQEIKLAFAAVLENRLPDLEKLLMQVAAEDPAKAIDLMIKLSNRFLPELSRQELTAKDGEDLFKNIKFQFGPTVEEDKQPGEEFDLDEL